MTDRWAADEEEMRHRRKLADYIDNPLSRNERETGIQFFGDVNRYQIYSYAVPVVRKLLRHRYAKIEWCYVAVRDGRGGRRENIMEISADDARHGIGGLQATMPLGTLTVKGSPRQRDILSGIVTTPEEVEDLDEVFAE